MCQTWKKTDAHRPAGSCTASQVIRHNSLTVDTSGTSKGDIPLVFPAGLEDTFSIKSLCQENCIQVGIVIQRLPHCSLGTVMKKDRVTLWNSLETQIKQSSNINPLKTNISTEEEVHYIDGHMYSMYLVWILCST